MTTSDASARANARQCFWIDSGPYDENGYVPSIVTEGQPGHTPMTGNGVGSAPWYWGKTREAALQVCKESNERLGLSERDVEEIVWSSMHAQTPEHAETCPICGSTDTVTEIPEGNR